MVLGRMIRLLFSLVVLHLLTSSTAVQVGQNCSLHVECNHGDRALHHSRCDKSSPDGQAKCACVDGYFGQDDDTVCRKPALDSACDNLPSDFCSTGVSNSKCKKGVCACRAKFYELEVGNRKICKPVIPGAPCNYASANPRAACKSDVDGGLVCNKGKQCSCRDNFIFSPSSTSCVKPIADAPACSNCKMTNGKCYDADQDGEPDGCECPPNKESSDQSDISVGCDVGRAEIGNYCDAYGKSIVCHRPNSHCVHVGDLSRNYHCACKPGFLAITIPGGQGERQCVASLPAHVDPNCETCENYNGACYDVDGDNLRDGCLCPLDRSTSDPEDYLNDCDILHWDITCQASKMTVCFLPFNSSEVVNIAPDDLDAGDSLIYIAENQWKDPCVFERRPDQWCVELSLKNRDYRRCGTKKSKPSRNEILYENRVILQKYDDRRSIEDVTFDVFCRYDTTVHTKSFDGAGVDISGKHRKAYTGKKVVPKLAFKVHDEYERDASQTGVKLGSPAKFIVEMRDNKNAYVAMKAETCVASSEPNLANPTGQSIMMLFDGCPTDNGFLSGDAMFSHEGDGKGDSRLSTGFFPIFQFKGRDIVYFHCSVIVCRQEEDCAPNDCTPGSRERRAVATSAAVVTESIHSSGIKVIPGGANYYKNQAIITSEDGGEQKASFSTETVTIIIAGLVTAIVTITALALVTILVLRRSLTAYSLPQSTPQSTPT